MKTYLFDFITVCGLGVVTYGASLVYVPAGFIIGGIALIGVAAFWDKG